jgi:hypothetical protein
VPNQSGASGKIAGFDGIYMIRVRRPLSIAIFGFAVVLAAAGAAVAQPMAAAQEKKTPPVLEPLPEIAGDADLEPQVTITRRKDQTVEEARVNGKLVWIKVTPLHGRPYFLIPDGGEDMFIRRDSLDSGLKVPLWVLLTF